MQWMGGRHLAQYAIPRRHRVRVHGAAKQAGVRDMQQLLLRVRQQILRWLALARM